MTSSLVLVVGIIAATYVFLSALLHFTQDSKEPSAIETSIPFMSPLLGLLPGMQKYFVKLRSVIQDMLSNDHSVCPTQSFDSPETYCWRK